MTWWTCPSCGLEWVEKGVVTMLCSVTGAIPECPRCSRRDPGKPHWPAIIKGHPVEITRMLAQGDT